MEGNPLSTILDTGRYQELYDHLLCVEIYKMGSKMGSALALNS